MEEIYRKNQVNNNDGKAAQIREQAQGLQTNGNKG